MKRLFEGFLESDDTLRVYEGPKLTFASDKDRLLPLMEYIGTAAPAHQGTVIMDKVMGNAAALLSIKAGCREVYSPLGGQLALKTLGEYNIEHHLVKVVPHIHNADGSDICLMEKLSIGKGPEEFYRVMRSLISEKPVPNG